VTIPVIEAQVYRWDTDVAFGLLPYTALDFEDELNGAGTLAITGAFESWYPVIADDGGTDRHVWDRPHVIRVLWDGVARGTGYIVEGVVFTPPDASGGADGEGWTVTITGRGLAAVLEDAVVAPDGSAPPEDQQRQWVGVPRASILRTLIGEAQGRGCFPALTMTGWSASVDADSASWTDGDTVRVRSGATVWSLLADWSDYGFDFHVDTTGNLSLWKVAGSDLHATVKLNPGLHYSPGGETWDLRTIVTAVTGENRSGTRVTLDDSTAVTAFRRRERAQRFGFVTNSASDVTQTKLDESSSITAERRLKLTPGVSGARPWVDFGLGDVIDVERDAPTPGLVQMRVLAFAVKLAEGNAPVIEAVCDAVLEHRRKTWINEVDATPGATGAGAGDPEPTTTYTADIYIPEQQVQWDWDVQGWPDTVAPPGANAPPGAGTTTPTADDPPFQAGVVTAMPPGAVLETFEFDSGVAGSRIADCSAAVTAPVTTTPTVWHFTATGSSGSYDVTRGAIETPIFTVNQGDLEAAIDAAMTAWFGGPGGGTITGDWDDWTWELPGAYPEVPIGVDDALLVGGTATATQSVFGTSANRTGLTNQFNCGLQVAGGVPETPLPGVKITPDGGYVGAGDGATVSLRAYLHNTDEDEDYASMSLSSQVGSIRARFRDDTGTIRDGSGLTGKDADGVPALTLNSPTVGVGKVRVDPLDADKLEALNPDGTVAFAGVTWPLLVDSGSYIGPYDPPADHAGTYVFEDGSTVNSYQTGVGGIEFVEYYGDTDKGIAKWDTEWSVAQWGGSGFYGLELQSNKDLRIVAEGTSSSILLYTPSGDGGGIDLKSPNVGIGDSGTELGFFGHATAAKPTVTGSRAGNAALASLLTALDGFGLLTDSSS